MSVNSRLKATKIIGQRKAFYRQRIPEFSCERKETVDMRKIFLEKSKFARETIPRPFPKTLQFYITEVLSLFRLYVI